MAFVWKYFDSGTQVFLDGIEQKTKNDSENWTSQLVAKKTGKKIKAGVPVTLSVHTLGGRTSPDFNYVRTQ